MGLAALVAFRGAPGTANPVGVAPRSSAVTSRPLTSPTRSKAVPPNVTGGL